MQIANEVRPSRNSVKRSADILKYFEASFFFAVTPQAWCFWVLQQIACEICGPGFQQGEWESELEIKSQCSFHGIVVRELAADVITLD